MALEFSDDVAPSHRDVTVHITLTPAEMRRIVEHEAGEPCFRMWVSHNERKRMATEWVAHPLSDGRYGIWRRESDLAKLRAGGEHDLAGLIESRKISDDIT